MDEKTDAAEEPMYKAEWAEEKESIWFKFQLLLGGMFFLFTPMFAVIFAVLLSQWSLVVITFGILLFTSFLEQVHVLLKMREQQIKKLPFMSEVISHFYGFYALYTRQRPKGFFYYLFFPRSRFCVCNQNPTFNAFKNSYFLRNVFVSCSSI